MADYLTLVNEAHQFNMSLKADEATGFSSNQFVQARNVAESFLQEALALPPDQQKTLLTLAQNENDSMRQVDAWMPTITEVFSHKTGELAQFQFSYADVSDKISNTATTVEPREVVNLYSP